MARAREIASLVLSKLDLPAVLDPLQGGEVHEYDYFRSVLDLQKLIGKKKLPDGIWEEAEGVMGLSRPIMVRHLNILELPNDLQYQADIYRLSERVLREVLKLPAGQWKQAIEVWCQV